MSNKTAAPWISIHPPRMGWDRIVKQNRRAMDFNPPTPHGVGHRIFPMSPDCFNISIHPPRMGWDPFLSSFGRSNKQFQSTHPAWGGTAVGIETMTPAQLFQSTHPAWGGTSGQIPDLPDMENFNPPTPHGVGPIMRLCK